MRRVAALLLVLSLSGCSFVEELFLSSGEKVNRAFPPGAEVRATEDALRNLVGDDDAAWKPIAAQYEALREIRGLTCTKRFTLSRFDSVETLRKLPVSRDCLNAQDAILLRFLQIKQVERRLAQGPLRPMAPLQAPTLVAPGIDLFSGISAPAAGVAVLSGVRGELLSVEMPSGKPIVKLPTLLEARFHDALLSPNGRVLALGKGFRSGVTFFDTETGAVLWDAPAISDLLAWLPGLSAALVNDAGGQLAIIDFQSGELAAGAPALKQQSWAVPLPDGRIVAGTGRTVSLIAYERGANGVEGTISRTFTIASGSGVTSLRPTPMLNGRALFFVSGRDFMQLDLESGEEKLWQTGEFISNQYAKLDESSVLLDAYVSPVKRQPWVLNIEDASFAPVETRQGSDGILYALDGRAGFMRRNHDGMWFGLELKRGAPVALDDYLSQRNLERQMAKLAAMTAPPAAQALSRGRDLRSAPPLAPLPTPGQGDFPVPFAQLAKDALIEGVGVYESANTLPQGPGNRPGSISLAVRPSTRPLVLVLSSYESVTWRITQGRERIGLILLSSYYPSSVQGAQGVRTVLISGGHAHAREGEGYPRLNQAVRAQTGKDIQVFQGSYYGTNFSVGGN